MNNKIVRQAGVIFAMLIIAIIAFLFVGCGEATRSRQHTHTYDSTWSVDATCHWHASTCGHAETEYREEHIFGQGMVVVPYYGGDTPGVRILCCMVCGYEKQEEFTSQHEHEWGSTYSFDAQGHWLECSDGSTDYYNLHEWGDWYINNYGRNSRQCTVCGYIEDEAYTVTWVNYDGTVLEIDEGVEYLDTPVYDGSTPAREGDAQYSYQFSAWSPGLQSVTSDSTYTAQFSSSINSYTVAWFNVDGSLLYSELVAYGTWPSFSGSIPTKQGDAQYTYMFDGWTPAIEYVSRDMAYTAQYYLEINNYDIVWLDEDGTCLDVTLAPYGSIPSFPGEMPTKDGNSQYSYTFAGWSPSVSSVTCEATYTAQYTCTTNTYTVTWVDENNNVIKEDEGMPYGATPYFDSIVPTKEPTDKYTYSFAGWSPPIESVTGNITYKARYDCSINEYPVILHGVGMTATVSFDMHGADGNIPSQLVTATHGLEYPEVPTRDGYLFGGWCTTLDCDVTFDFSSTISDNLTLYARWIPYSDAATLVVDGEETECFIFAEHYYAFVPLVSGELSVATRWLIENQGDLWDDSKVDLCDSTKTVIKEYVGCEHVEAGNLYYLYITSQGAVSRIAVSLTMDQNISAGGAAPNDTKVFIAYDSDFVFPIITKEGHTFDGWYDGADGTGTQYTDNMGHGIHAWDKPSVTDLYPKWIVHEHTVVWKDYDGSVLETDSGVLYGEIPSYDGSSPTRQSNAQYTYTFSGWSPAVCVVNEDVEYYAQYTETVNSYTIMWVNEDGDLLETDPEVLYGDIPAYNGITPTKAATDRFTYLFDDWSPEISPVTQNATYRATFTSITNRYEVILSEVYTTISFDLNGAEGSVPSQNISATQGMTYPDVPSREGYLFGGWFTSIACDTPFDFSAKIEGDTIVYAKWIEGTTLASAINYGDNSISIIGGSGTQYFAFIPLASGNITIRVGRNAWIGLSKTPPTSGDYGGSAYNSITAYVQCGTVYYISLQSYKHKTDSTYIGSTYLNIVGDTPSAGGTAKPCEIAYDSSFSLPVAVKLGYSFQGWFDGEGGIGTQYTDSAGESVLVWDKAVQTTLYPKWCPVEYPISVTIDGIDVSAEYPDTYTIEDEVPLLAPSRIGYILRGWLADEMIPVGSTGSVEIDAYWQAIQYTISYNMADGVNALDNPVSYTIEDTFILLWPTRGGYHFAGWVGSNGLDPQLMVTVPVGTTGALAYTATWSLATYSVEYELYGGTNAVKNPASYTTLDTITLKDAAKEGYDFIGWYTEPEFEHGVSTLNGLYGDLILYARWSPIRSSATFDPGDAYYTLTYDTYDSFRIYKDQEFHVYDFCPTKTGYIFDGWYDIEGHLISSGFVFSEDTVLYPGWYHVTNNEQDISKGSISVGANASQLTHTHTRYFYLPSYCAGDTCVYVSQSAKSSSQYYHAAYASLSIRDLTSNTTMLAKSGGNKKANDSYYLKTTVDIVLVPGHVYAIGVSASFSQGATTSNSSASSIAEIYRVGYGVLPVEPTMTRAFNYDQSTTSPIPHVDGYDFVGWYDVDDVLLGDVWLYTANQTFHARWEIHEYVISYVLNGGVNDDTNPTHYTMNDSFALQDPTRSGYRFLGWYYNNLQYGQRITVIEGSSMTNYTLYALWEPNVYTATLDYNGGQNCPHVEFYSCGILIKSQDLYKDSTLAYYTPPAPSQNQVFGGWFTDTDCTQPYAYEGVLDSDLTLYAKWIDVTDLCYNPLGCDVNVQIEGNGYVYMAIVAPFAQSVTVTSFSDLDLFGVLMDADMSVLVESDDISDEDLDFSLSFNMVPGRLYYVGFRAHQALCIGDATISISGACISDSALVGDYTLIMESIDIAYDSSYSLPLPKKEGCSFVGWFDENGQAYDGVQWLTASDVVLYAIWEAIE